MTPNVTQEQALQQYHTEIKQHGPLAPNWEVKQAGGYVNTDNEESDLYPMCPQARAAGVKLLPDKSIGRYTTPGVSNTPSWCCYAPANWTWIPDERPEALYKALLYSKATNKDGDPVSRQDVDAGIQIARCKTNLDNTLYHPMNRKEPLFNGEGIAAEVARIFKRSLWVICPRLQEVVDWNAAWHPQVDHRPPIHLRFGPGAQGDYPPAVVGLLPVMDSIPNAHWFSVQPCRRWKIEWERLYVNTDFDLIKIANKLGFPDGPLLYVQYALVACYRTILLAPAGSKTPRINNWISLYIQHLIQTHPRGTQQKALVPFKYNKTKPLESAKHWGIRPIQLEAWIITAKPGSPLHVFSDRWNKVMAAKICYTKSSTLANWEALIEAQEKVAQLTTDS